MTQTASLPPRARVLGCEIDRLDMHEALERCERHIEARVPAQHMAVNAAKVVAMQDDTELLRLVNSCEIVTADGQAVVWASRLLGDPLPTRVTGIDLMYELIALAERNGYGVYVLGGRSEVLEQAVARMRGRHPGLRIVGHRDGYFAQQEERDVVAAIRRTKPDLLFVAMPSPGKERFIGRWREELDIPFCMGVGGSIDVIAGVTRRAPRPLQRLGLEWAYRLAQEPRRLLRRYLVSNWRFVALTLRQAAAGAGRRLVRQLTSGGS
jgi:N-acetylglucosaminyldiphosphoundecaprenol N-acetyl-beta-D-mannosaminyltransferase